MRGEGGEGSVSECEDLGRLHFQSPCGHVGKIESQCQGRATQLSVSFKLSGGLASLAESEAPEKSQKPCVETNKMDNGQEPSQLSSGLHMHAHTYTPAFTQKSF